MKPGPRCWRTPTGHSISNLKPRRSTPAAAQNDATPFKPSFYRLVSGNSRCRQEQSANRHQNSSHYQERRQPGNQLPPLKIYVRTQYWLSRPASERFPWRAGIFPSAPHEFRVQDYCRQYANPHSDAGKSEHSTQDQRCCEIQILVRKGQAVSAHVRPPAENQGALPAVSFH